MALQEHFRDAGRHTEVAVDLERRMRVEEVRIGVELEEVLHDEEGVVAVLHPRPEIHFPAEAPAGGHVAALEQRRPGGFEQLGRACLGDLVGRIQPVQV